MTEAAGTTEAALPVTARWRRRLAFAAVLWVAGALAGVLYSVVRGRFGGTDLLVGVVYALLVAIPGSMVEIALGLPWTRQRLRRYPLAVTLALRTLIYGLIIVPPSILAWGHVILGLPSPPMGTEAWSGIVFSIVAVAVINLGVALVQIVGVRTMGHLLLGRYHAPRRERHFVLFVDVIGSTAMAETRGDLVAHRLLDRLFSAASAPVLEHGGEIYQYVGDQMVVTWPDRGGAPDPRPLACFFSLRKGLERMAPRLLREFGIAPGLRGSLHCGDVVVGEIGDLKRDIVFHGDVMNTAARLEAESRNTAMGFVASAEAVARMPETQRRLMVPMGSLALRGRAAPVEAFTLAAPAQVSNGTIAARASIG